MLRLRIALLASAVCLCWIVAGSERPVNGQIIYPLPSREPVVLTSDNATSIHTCALPPGYALAVKNNSLELLSNGTRRIVKRVNKAALAAWETVAKMWSPDITQTDVAMSSPKQPATFRSVAATFEPVESSQPTPTKSNCPLSFLLDMPALTTPAISMGQDSASLSSTADDLPKLSFFWPSIAEPPVSLRPKDRSVFSFRTVTGPRQVSPRRSPTVGPMPLRPSSGSSPSSWEVIRENLETATENLASNWGAAQLWLTDQTDRLENWGREIVAGLAINNGVLTAPPQSDPGPPHRIAAGAPSMVSTPFGPVYLRKKESNSAQSIARGNPLRNGNPGVIEITRHVTRIAISANPLQAWQDLATATSRELTLHGDILNVAIDRWRETRPSQIPPLPEIDRPKIISVNATREAEETKGEEPENSDPQDASPQSQDAAFSPTVNPGWTEVDPWWWDADCPCERAVDDYEQIEQTTEAEVSSVSAWRSVPAQSLGNIARILADPCLQFDDSLAISINQQQDGLTEPSASPTDNRLRLRTSDESGRLDLGAGYRPGQPRSEKSTKLTLAELEFVNQAAKRIGFATSRVALGFQEAAGILINQASSIVEVESGNERAIATIDLPSNGQDTAAEANASPRISAVDGHHETSER
ncbi:MAG: hypothetical protein MPJ50_04885 [Pirellulales bacterium]|nr:hypothetical protein [Pirellulales bacterium]